LSLCKLVLNKAYELGKRFPL